MTDATLAAAREVADSGRIVLYPVPSANAGAALARLLEVPQVKLEEARSAQYAMLGSIEHPELAGYPVCESIEARAQEFLVDGAGRLVSLSSAQSVLDPKQMSCLEHVQALAKLLLRLKDGTARVAN